MIIYVTATSHCDKESNESSSKILNMKVTLEFFSLRRYIKTTFLILYFPEKIFVEYISKTISPQLRVTVNQLSLCFCPSLVTNHLCIFGQGTGNLSRSNVRGVVL